MTKRIFAFDLDGTLTNSKKEISKNTKEMIIKLQQEGNIMVLASGRPLLGVLPLALDLEFDRYGGYIICLNGAMIYNCKTNQKILDIELPKEYIEPLIKYSREKKIASLSYDSTSIITEMPNDRFVGFEAYNNKLEIKGVNNLIDYINFSIEKIMFVGDENLILSFYDDIKEKFPKLSIYRSMPYFLEIMNVGIDKKEALKVLLDELKIERKNLISFGDGLNDLPMLEYSGFSVVMANASDDVKKYADYITLSNDEDGVAYALDKINRGEIYA